MENVRIISLILTKGFTGEFCNTMCLRVLKNTCDVLRFQFTNQFYNLFHHQISLTIYQIKISNIKIKKKYPWSGVGVDNIRSRVRFRGWTIQMSFFLVF